VVMLHPDYQYTPKLIRAMVSMIAEADFDVVLGSRILGVGALAGLVGGGGFKEAQTENREQQVVKNCIRARGYNVLG